jgi:drug/metabolite transporter (DMT)-like permease
MLVAAWRFGPQNPQAGALLVLGSPLVAGLSALTYRDARRLKVSADSEARQSLGWLARCLFGLFAIFAAAGVVLFWPPLASSTSWLGIASLGSARSARPGGPLQVACQHI